MKVFFCKQMIFIPKLFILLLLFSIFLFTSCGKDKTIEKIIYGDTPTSGNTENNGKILSREQFNSVAVTQEFNSIDDFYNYMLQCYTNKTNLLGIKFKIKASFNLTDTLQYYPDLNDENHYFYKTFSKTIGSNPNVFFSVDFTDTDLNSDVSSIDEVTFIVRYCYYYYSSGSINIGCYSYL